MKGCSCEKTKFAVIFQMYSVVAKSEMACCKGHVISLVCAYMYVCVYNYDLASFTVAMTKSART